jgi:AcrR family transcriptional regulator
LVNQTSEAGGNRRGRETRQQLLRATWSLIGELTFSDIVRLVPAKAIAERAGRTEGAFRHHFPDNGDFVRALVEVPRRDGLFGGSDDLDSYNAVRAVLEEFEAHEIVGVVRSAALADFETTRRPSDLAAARGELLLLTRVSNEPELTPVVAQGIFRNLIPPYRESYQAAMDRIGASLLEDFDIDQFTTILTALDWGLLLYWLADPELASRDFVVDALSVVAMSLAVQSDQPVRRLADIEAATVPFLADDRPLDRDGRLAVAAAAHHLFERDVRAVAFSAIADVAEVDTITLRRSFGRPEVVAAWSFVVHLDEIRHAGNANAARDPERPVADALCELVRVVRRDPHVARALLDERLAPTGDEIRAALPLASVLAGAGVGSDAEQLVDLALTLALSDTRSAPASLAARLSSLV